MFLDKLRKQQEYLRWQAKMNGMLEIELAVFKEVNALLREGKLSIDAGQRITSTMEAIEATQKAKQPAEPE